MIRFDNVGYHYAGDARPAVTGVSFELEEGSFHFLTGPSGAGKTTVFRLLYLDMLPTQGHITMFGKNIAKLGEEEVAFTRRKMGIVFQDYRLLPHLTVRENVALPLNLYGYPTREQDKAVDDMLAWVGLADKKDETPDRLSGGEKQRVGIARAVVHRPQVLVADEPTGNLDDAMAKRILHLLVELNKHGTTVLVATHDKELVRSFKYPVLTMKGGRLQQEDMA
ncbi:MAG: cell division ATP-binding protein FtsE [Alphaproteobacteria bacterium]